MNDWIRRLRGALGTGALWSALGATVGVAIGVIGWIVDGTGTFAEWTVTLGLGFGGFSFVAGTGFAALLTLADGRKRLGELSPRRAAVWGGLAGAVLPLGVVAVASGGALPLLPALGVAAVFGGVTASLGAATIHAAQQGPDADGAVPDDAVPADAVPGDALFPPSR